MKTSLMDLDIMSKHCLWEKFINLNWSRNTLGSTKLMCGMAC